MNFIRYDFGNVEGTYCRSTPRCSGKCETADSNFNAYKTVGNTSMVEVEL